MTNSEKNLKQIFTGPLHHAYLIEGDGGELGPLLQKLFEKELGIKTIGNPDFRHVKFETLAIDDARALREAQEVKTFDSSKKIFLIEAASITNEAQNALLKIFEEPTAGTHFFLVMPSRWLLLPTVRSRLQIVATGAVEKKSTIEPAAFMKAASAARLALLESILEEKDKTAALIFVDTLILFVHENAATEKKNPVLKELLHVRQYLSDRSASLKLLLEYLALTLPPL